MMNLPQAEPQAMVEAPGPDTESLRRLLESKNLVDKLSKERLEELSQQVADGFEYDLQSRADWEKNLQEWTDLALQVKEEKTYPWVGASNVKYPLLSTAAMQFNARAYPSLVPSTGDLVKCETIGMDKTGVKLDQGKRVAKFMSYQILNRMDGWEEDMDKLLIMLPIVGTVFKKTYYSSVHKKNVSELILPKDIVVDYWAKNLETAERISQVLMLNKREIKERQMSKIYSEVELGDPAPSADMLRGHNFIKQDSTLPYTIVEQHTYFDMDEDGYAEPYVVTFERTTKKILRIAARYDETTIFLNDDESLQKIEPIQYFTKFSFIPNPNGSFYDIGFGLLLSPLNESVNTLINQLIDSGTLNNLQGGFLGKGIKLKMGGQQWTPGEWKSINAIGDDLRKQIVPLPTKEPSAVLFQLMGTLVTSGKELASVAEIFTGKMPGQNTPATTTMATVEQGMKVFTAVYKRIYRSLKEEYKKLFKLNSVYLEPTEYQNILDIPVDASDFNLQSYDICPSADPSTPTQTEKLLKAQGLLELLPLGMLDPVEVVRRVLDAQEQPNVETLFNQQIQQTGAFEPPPDPKLQEMQMKGQMEEQKAAMKQQEMMFKSELAARDQVFKQTMEAQRAETEAQSKMMMAKVDAAVSIYNQRIFSAEAKAKAVQGVVQKEQQHRQTMRHKEEQAKLQKQQTQTTSKTGKSTK
jgi:chaperonin GroES